MAEKNNRSAYAKFRCDADSIKVKTGRYRLNRVPVEKRLCESCKVIEYEFHALLQC